ncbi:alpha/beta hydrolase [Citrobacter sp. MNAZ 1397]|uniref:alpha/beta hydrolase n=1 Tax=Citrobacter sp. MNAZ 1397 TaxID=2911205 RepID=UPI002026A746|nr:alpha/beta hydrolase [Citrobacter sp. MNAZ 1397]MCL9671898.1 alpha/beta hydrolase [Citrobacter sp. MNAZ 1397]
MNTWNLVDPELRPALADSRPLSLTQDALVTLRQQRQQAALANVQRFRETGLSVEEHLISASAQPAVRVCVIAPAAPGQNRMGILHIHGGGHLFGSPEQSLSLTGATALQHDCVIVSVDYRLAPETVFPGSLEDCYAALVWMTERATALGIHPDHIGLMGDSAGAGLAASLALLARDRHGPSIAFQNLMFPMLDDRTVTEENPNPVTGEFVWTREYNRFGWTSLLGCEPGSEGVSVYAAPARATDLTHLPPTWLGVGTLDLFLDENLRFAQGLIRAGVAVEMNVWPGAYHGFNSDPQARVAQRAREQRQAWIAQFKPTQG